MNTIEMPAGSFFGTYISRAASFVWKPVNHRNCYREGRKSSVREFNGIEVRCRKFFEEVNQTRTGHSVISRDLVRRRN